MSHVNCEASHDITDYVTKSHDMHVIHINGEKKGQGAGRAGPDRHMAFLPVALPPFRGTGWVISRHTSAVASLRQLLGKQLDSIRNEGTWKNERVITSPQAAAIRVQGSDRQILNFCANNYLGLSVSQITKEPEHPAPKTLFFLVPSGGH